jgi:DNA-directed RNA polymerase specialized sigma subunit
MDNENEITPKQFLWQYIDAEKEINAKMKRIARYREMATKTTATLSDIRVKTSQDNRMERVLDEICDLGAEIESDVKLLKEKQKVVRDTIRMISDARQRIVLELRYLNGETFEEIAVDINYCYMQVCRIHGKALDAIKDVIKCYNEK